MESIIVNNCPACEPVNRLVNDLTRLNFSIIEEKLEDHHFHQLYFKLEGDMKKMKKINISGFSKVENKFVCDCHWPTIEIINHCK
jgi:hypothetical protein